jgi:hypothetical protein
MHLARETKLKDPLKLVVSTFDTSPDGHAQCWRTTGKGEAGGATFAVFKTCHS